MDQDGTQKSLLLRAQTGDSAAWQRLADLYRPFITGWAKRHTTAPEDAEDLSQEILLRVFRYLPRFEHNGRAGAFRSWLRTIAVSCTHDNCSARKVQPRGSGDATIEASLHELEDPSSRLAQAWDKEHDQYVLKRLLEYIDGEFESHTMQAFHRQVFDCAAPEAVAQELQMSIRSVYTAKSRVLQRMRQLSAGLLDWGTE